MALLGDAQRDMHQACRLQFLGAVRLPGMVTLFWDSCPHTSSLFDQLVVNLEDGHLA